jgi:regulator of sigma E protease
VTILSAIVLLGIIIFVHEVGHFLAAKLMGVRVLKFSIGFGPKLIGKKYGDTEYLISSIPFGGYVKMFGEERGEELKEEEKPVAYTYQPVWKRFIIVFFGPLFNFALSYFIFVSFLANGLPVGIPKLEGITTHIDEVLQNSPAEKAGLKRGDKIVSIDGRDVYTWDEMTEIIRNNPGKELYIRVARDEQKLDFKIIPEAVKTKNLSGKEIIIGRLGISKTKIPVDIITSKSIFNAPLKGLEATYKISIFILEVTKKLIVGSIPFRTVGGPITIVHEAGKVAAIGILPYFMFIALISVNLAVLNLLPIPILDGGHILFLGIEAIRRRPLNEKVIAIAQRIGLAIILFIMVFVLYFDIMRLITGRLFP